MIGRSSGAGGSKWNDFPIQVHKRLNPLASKDNGFDIADKYFVASMNYLAGDPANDDSRRILEAR